MQESAGRPEAVSHLILLFTATNCDPASGIGSIRLTPFSLGSRPVGGQLNAGNREGLRKTARTEVLKNVINT
ncbi:MAG: hypothetical protein ACOYM3_21335, partial [Terrimicrobiaceae bacterium]